MSGQYGDRQQAQTNQLQIWKFEKSGDATEGVYRGERQLNPQYPPLFVVGEQLVPRKKQLETAFATIPVGSYVWITFKGKESIKGGKTVNNFTVEYAAPKVGAPTTQVDGDDEKEPF